MTSHTAPELAQARGALPGEDPATPLFGWPPATLIAYGDLGRMTYPSGVVQQLVHQNAETSTGWRCHISMDMIYEDRRTVSAVMLDTQSDKSRVAIMGEIEKALTKNILRAATMDGAVLDVPSVTWTCSVIGRSKGEGTVVRSQVTGT